MRILVVGAGGTLGAALVRELEEARGHRVVRASRRGPVRVDLGDPASIDEMFAEAARGGAVDAVVAVAGSGRIAGIGEASDEAYFTGLEAKLLGQVHLVRKAARQVADGGSVTLTGGIWEFAEPGLSFTALTNAGLAGFVPAAALEMPRGIRLNAVSPGWVSETLEAMGRDGAEGTPAARVAGAYVRLIEGTDRGRVVDPSAPVG